MEPSPPIPPKKKRKKPFAANAAAMKDMREMGFTADKVEQRIPHCFITRDLFGCIDILAMRKGIGVLGVQATAGSNHSARVLKSIAEPRLRLWLELGNRFEVWSYNLRGAAGTRKKYELRRQEITLADLPMEPNDSSPRPALPITAV